MILIKHKDKAVTRCLVLLFSFRVRYQTFQASHLVPETDGGLQERVDHGPDVLLVKWPGPLRPHPQIQATADVGNIKPAELLLISVFTKYFCVLKDCTLSAMTSRKETRLWWVC